jgi:hypothetical protein
LTNIIRNAACSGAILGTRTSTSRVGPHSPSEAPPVWVKPVRHPAATNRGYLNSSTQRVFLTTGTVLGKTISLGSIISAQASDCRASSWRPMSISLRGDAGAVLAIEASRLARNGREWHTLIEFCGLVGAVIVDEDGIYDPRHPMIDCCSA